MKQLPQDTVTKMQYAGIFSDDSTFDDWMEKLAAIRREANQVKDLETQTNKSFRK